MDQILQRGRSAHAPHNRAFSSALNQTQNNPLVRKDETPLTSGIQVTSAQLVSAPQQNMFEEKPHLRVKLRNIRISLFFLSCRTSVQTRRLGQR